MSDKYLIIMIIMGFISLPFSYLTWNYTIDKRIDARINRYLDQRTIYIDNLICKLKEVEDE